MYDPHATSPPSHIQLVSSEPLERTRYTTDARSNFGWSRCTGLIIDSQLCDYVSSHLRAMHHLKQSLGREIKNFLSTRCARMALCQTSLAQPLLDLPIISCNATLETPPQHQVTRTGREVRAMKARVTRSVRFQRNIGSRRARRIPREHSVAHNIRNHHQPNVLIAL